MVPAKVRDHLKDDGITAIRKGTLRYLHYWHIYNYDEFWKTAPREVIEQFVYKYLCWIRDTAVKMKI